MSIFLIMCFMLLSGCSIFSTANYVPSVSSDEKDSRPLVVTTIFPYYDFVRQIAGNRVRLKMVVPAGMDSHSFEPTPADMITMQQADLMVCNGGEMEQWVEKVTASLDTENMKILTMMDYVDVLEEDADISQMAVRQAEQVKKCYVPERCEKLGITIPDDVKSTATLLP